MNKKSEITGPLNIIVQEISREAEKKLKEIKEKFQQHEQDFRKKICHQIEQIKSVLEQLDNGTGGKIKTLKASINKLVGKGEEETNVGKLGNLLDGIRKIGEMRQPDWGDVFNWKVPIRNAADVMMAVRNIWFQKSYYKVLVTQAILHLRAIRDGLNKIDIQNVISEIKGHSGNEIEQYEGKIKKHKDEMWKLEQLRSSHQRYMGYVKRMKTLIRHLKFLKMKGNKGKLCDRIQYIVDDMEDIKYSELTRIDGEIDEIINNAKKVYRDLENTQKMFKYLTCVKQQKDKIRKLSINGTSFDEIESTIEKVKSVGETIQKAKEGISQAREKLRSALQEGSDKDQSGQRNGENENMIPKGLDLNGEEVFKEYQIKLEGIKEFKRTLDGITPGMSELTSGNSQEPNGSDVVKTLEWLEKIDGILTQVSQKINKAVTEMQKSYGGYKEKINGSATKGGTSIMSNVESIKKIPSEILKLQSEVRYHVVLLNIAKSVNGTLDSVKNDAGNLERIGVTIKGIKRCIRSMKERYEYINVIIKRLGCFKFWIRVASIKEYVVCYRQMIVKIRENLRYIEWSRGQISKTISEIKEYLNDLIKISKEIAVGFSKIGIENFGMALVLMAHPIFGSILHGIHGLMLPLVTRHLIFLSVRIGIIMARLSLIRMKLERIVGSNLVGSIEGKVNEVDARIIEVEMSIETVIICFLKCSNKYITDNKIKSAKRLLASRGQEYNNELARPFLRCLETMFCQYNI